LARQLLLDREAVPAVDVVARLVGMQGQEAKHPYVGLWSRIDGFEESELDRAVQERDVVRGTLFRGTLHLVTAADYLRFRTTVSPVLEAGLKVLGDRGEGLDPVKVVAAAKKLLAKEPLTFTEKELVASPAPQRCSSWFARSPPTKYLKGSRAKAALS